MPLNDEPSDQGSTAVDGILSVADVCSKLGVSRSTLFRMRRRREFPEPVRISNNRCGFLQSEVNDWLAARADRRGCS